jgi:hypothetical protein
LVLHEYTKATWKWISRNEAAPLSQQPLFLAIA